MPRSRKATPYELRYANGHFRVATILTDEALEDLMVLARSRIIGVFREATEKIRRDAEPFEHRHNKAVGLLRPYWRTVRTDNYIGGVGCRQKDLAWHIQSKIKNHFLRSEDLLAYGRTTRAGNNHLKWVTQVNEAHVQGFIAAIEQQVILAQLNMMVAECEIWYNENECGIWQMQQSVIDEFREQKLARRQALEPKFKRDDRSYHGRNRGQSVRRGIAPGTSIGGQYAY